MKYIALTASLVAATVLSSCYAGMNDRPIGMLYANVTDPVAAGSSNGSRVGKSESVSYLGLIATGDSSIAAAKANGGISSVSTVDVQRENILGIINKSTTIVKGN